MHVVQTFHPAATWLFQPIAAWFCFVVYCLSSNSLPSMLTKLRVLYLTYLESKLARCCETSSCSKKVTIGTHDAEPNISCSLEQAPWLWFAA